MRDASRRTRARTLSSFLWFFRRRWTPWRRGRPVRRSALTERGRSRRLLLQVVLPLLQIVLPRLLIVLALLQVVTLLAWLRALRPVAGRVGAPQRALLAHDRDGAVAALCQRKVGPAT